MRRVPPAVWAVGLVVVVWILLHVLWYPHHQLVDTPEYQHYGDSLVYSHTVPYRDFQLEYPPGALPVFMIPSWFDWFDYRKAFQLEMFACHLAIVLAVLRLGGRRAAAFAAVAPLLLGSVVLSRFDFWPAALAAGALVALVRGSRGGSAVLLASSFATKLWAGALAPVFVVWLWRREGRRSALEWAAAAAAVAAAWFVPFAVLGANGLDYMFHRQLGRPLQIESLGAQLLIAAHHLFGTSAHVVATFGSQNLVGTGTHTAANATSAVEVLAVALVWTLFARGEMTERRLLAACAAVVAALIAFGKVFSPQFLIWLIPFVPAVRRRPAWITFGIALVLTQVYFPSRYWRLANHLEQRVSWIVLARDLAIVALAAVLVYALAGDRISSSDETSSAVS